MVKGELNEASLALETWRIRFADGTPISAVGLLFWFIRYYIEIQRVMW
jgi:hypothetical protein